MAKLLNKLMSFHDLIGEFIFSFNYWIPRSVPEDDKQDEIVLKAITMSANAFSVQGR